MRKVLIKIISLKDKRLNERKIIEENNNDEWIKGYSSCICYVLVFHHCLSSHLRFCFVI